MTPNWLEPIFQTAYNYKIDPEINPMRKAKFSTQGIVGLLDKYDIKMSNYGNNNILSSKA